MRTHTGKTTGRTAAQGFMPLGAAEARAKLSGLQLNPRLAPFVRNEIKACDAALHALQLAGMDEDEAAEAARQIQQQVEKTIEIAKRRYEGALRFDEHNPRYP